jgi:multidrug efflux pump subunit AcrA (membrane-fusion protein)
MRLSPTIPLLAALFLLAGLHPAESAEPLSHSGIALQASEEKESSDSDNEPSHAKEKPEADADKKAVEEPSTKDESADKPAKEASEPATSDEDKSDAKKPADASSTEKPAAKPAAKKRKTHKVDTKRLTIDVTLDGTFVARQTQEVPLRPETWSDYEIVEVVEHGEKVRKGETLIKFDTEKLNEAIADLELDQRLNELSILKTEEDMPRLEKTLKLDFEAAQRANEQAKEDFERYQEIDRPMAVKSAEFLVKYYDFMFHYEKDELDQLEKMYEADDLTEETEEIVLKRQRTSVEFAEFSLENARLNRDETLNVRLPRFDISVKEALERTALAEARAQMALSLDLNRARYELEQRKKARTKSLDRHADLLKDRDLMEIKSPADGIVFYGQSVAGRWSDTATLINKYKPHQNVTPGSILMTIVEPRPVFVTSTLDEAKRPDVSDGQNAKLVLPAEGADRIGAEVKSISTIPVSPGKFAINFEFAQEDVPDWIVPGMSCKVQIRTYDKKDAVVIPKAAIRDDEDNEEQKYVWLVDPDDDEARPQRRNVKLGKTKGADVEIIKGLKEGDVISLDDEATKKDS